MFTGLAPLRVFEHDIFFLLDNAYRVVQGQVPHRDFFSAWGPVIHLIGAGGLLLTRMKPDGIAYANAICAALIGIWAYRVGRGRLGSVAACCMGIYTVLLIATPSSLGYGALMFSHAMVYNRYGFALLGIILVECGTHFLGTEATRRGAISSGAAFAILGFLKISYALAAAPILVLGYAVGCGRGRRRLTFCGTAAIVSLPFLGYLRFDVGDMLRDLSTAGAARRLTWHPAELFADGFALAGETIPLLLLLATLALARRSGAAGESKWRVRELVLAAVTIGVGALLLTTNHQPGGLPLNAFAALVLASAYSVRRDKVDGPLGLAVTFLMVACVLRVAAPDAISLGAAAWERYRGDAHSLRLASERGASIDFEPVRCLTSSETGGPGYVAALNDGMELLRRHTRASDGVLAIDMMNPFNYLLGRRSPVGGVSAGAYNYVLSDAAHPTDERFFGNARCVLVRKYGRDAGDYALEQFNIDGLFRIYRPALEARFQLVEETRHWRLYILRAGVQARTGPTMENPTANRGAPRRMERQTSDRFLTVAAPKGSRALEG